MKHFEFVSSGIPVHLLLDQISKHPELWDENDHRKSYANSPHAGTRDIWVRFNSQENLQPGNYGALSDQHIPVWYPAWGKLTALKPIIFRLMAKVQGEMLGGVLITKVPPRGRIAPHRDDSWHVRYFSKFYVFLQSPEGALFGAQDGNVTDELQPNAGDCYYFDNRKLHWVENRSDEDRITLIVCIRTDLFPQ